MRGNRKVESNDSPEIPDRRRTSDTSMPPFEDYKILQPPRKDNMKVLAHRWPHSWTKCSSTHSLTQPLMPV